MLPLIQRGLRDFWKSIATLFKSGSRDGEIQARLFFLLLVGLFALSLLPFAFAPSAILTATLSLPPFILIYLQARFKKNQVSDIIETERKFLEVFSENADPRLRELAQNPTQSVSEQDVMSLVPEAIRKASSRAKFLLEEIASGKFHLLDTPRESIVRPLRESLEAQLADVSYYGSLSTKVGILGTFFGFIIALVTLSAFFASFGLAANLQTSADLIQETLRNLAYAFIKSVYGLAFAILISTNVSNLRRGADRIYPLFDKALSFGREFVNRMTLANPAIHSSLLQVQTALNNVSQRLSTHSGDVAESLRTHGQLINEQTKLFSSAAQDIVAAQGNWDQAFANLHKAAKMFDERTSGSIERAQEGFTSAASKFEAMLQSLDDARTELARGSDSLLETARGSDARWAERFEDFITHARDEEKRFSQWANATNNAFEAVKTRMEAIESNLTAGYSSLESNAIASRDLATAVRDLSGSVTQQMGAIENNRKTNQSSLDSNTLVSKDLAIAVKELSGSLRQQMGSIENNLKAGNSNLESANTALRNVIERLNHSLLETTREIRDAVRKGGSRSRWPFVVVVTLVASAAFLWTFYDSLQIGSLLETVIQQLSR